MRLLIWRGLGIAGPVSRGTEKGWERTHLEGVQSFGLLHLEDMVGSSRIPRCLVWLVGWTIVELQFAE